MSDGVGWRDDSAIDDVVCDIKHTTQECLIAGNAFRLECFATISHAFGFDDETAFRTNRHDYCIFDHLCFDEAQYFGTEIFHTI